MSQALLSPAHSAIVAEAVCTFLKEHRLGSHLAAKRGLRIKRGLSAISDESERKKVQRALWRIRRLLDRLCQWEPGGQLTKENYGTVVVVLDRLEKGAGAALKSHLAVHQKLERQHLGQRFHPAWFGPASEREVGLLAPEGRPRRPTPQENRRVEALRRKVGELRDKGRDRDADALARDADALDRRYRRLLPVRSRTVRLDSEDRRQLRGFLGVSQLPLWARQAIERFWNQMLERGHSRQAVRAAVQVALGPLCAAKRSEGLVRRWKDFTRAEQQEFIESSLRVQEIVLGDSPADLPNPRPQEFVSLVAPQGAGEPVRSGPQSDLLVESATNGGSELAEIDARTARYEAAWKEEGKIPYFGDKDEAVYLSGRREEYRRKKAKLESERASALARQERQKREPNRRALLAGVRELGVPAAPNQQRVHGKPK